MKKIIHLVMLASIVGCTLLVGMEEFTAGAGAAAGEVCSLFLPLSDSSSLSSLEKIPEALFGYILGYCDPKAKRKLRLCSHQLKQRSTLNVQCKPGISGRVLLPLLITSPYIKNLKLKNYCAVECLKEFVGGVNYEKSHGFKTLQSLNVSYTLIEADKVAAIVERLPNLTELKLNLCRGSCQFLSRVLSSCDKMKKLDLSSTFVTVDEVAAIIKGCPKLTKLNLSHCRNSAEGICRGLLSIDGNPLSLLKELHLDGTFVTPAQIKEILLRCPNITVLNVANFINNRQGEGVAGGLIEALSVGKGLFLKMLCLDCTGATAGDVETILTLCPELVGVTLKFCQGCVVGLVAALRNGGGRKLEAIDLECVGASAEDVEVILRSCPNLIELRLNRNTMNSTAGLVAALQDGCGSKLNVVDLCDCYPYYPYSIITAIQVNSPGCAIVY